MRPFVKTPWRDLMIADASAYGTARHFVLTTSGFYCAYCETPLGVDMPVEHKLPKGGEIATFANCYPDLAIAYGNFDMACSACNSVKNAHPNQDDAAAFLSQFFKRSKYDYNQLVYGGLYAMVWPDSMKGKTGYPEPVPDLLRKDYTGVDPTFNLFRYDKKAVSQVDLHKEGLLRLSDFDLKQPWAAAAQDMVWVTPNRAYIDAQPKKDMLLARVKNTLVCLNLNYSNPDDSKASDRRTRDRTAAWAVALAALADLTQTVAMFGLKKVNVYTAPTYLAVQAIRELALATGYWSVWMTVFAAISNRAGPPWNDDAKMSADDCKELVRALFVQYLVWENRARVYSFQPNPPTVFMGTNLDLVKL
ncbi:MAG: hypothetical protein K2X44_02565 [Magnetospirillum sp.]|nr:hypothetical protein [Magnetospirillum sp.]